MGLLTADCAPVLLVDAQVGVIGAAHAGWRGALAGVLGSAVGAMETLGAKPSRIQAVIGPAIGPASYEVGPEFPTPFLAQNQTNDAFFSEASGQLRFDLPGYIAASFWNLASAPWTSAMTPSPRSSSATAEPQRLAKTETGETGRQLSVICLG